MAGDPHIKEADDKPVLNQFGLPVICNDTSDDYSGPCCEPCSDWMYCLLQTFYVVDIPDPIEFDNWIADHWLSGNVQYKNDQLPLTFSATSGSPTAIFDGKWLAEPPNQDVNAQACAPPLTRGGDDECNHTHKIRHERTLFSNSKEGEEVKRFGMNVNTECVQVGDDKFLRFTLNLVWQGHSYTNAYFEPPIGYLEDEVTDAGVYCPPKPRTPWVPDVLGNEWFCCPFAVSDLIDVTSITSLADLDSVILHKLPPATATFEATLYGVWVGDSTPSQSCLQRTGVWACTDSALMINCFGGMPVCLYFEHDNYNLHPICHYFVDEIDVYPAYYPWPIGESCSSNASGEDLCNGEVTGCTWIEYAGGTNTPGSGVCNTSYCISRPLEFGAGDIVLSVIDNKCRGAEDCKSCFPDPESPVATPIKHGDVRFETDTPPNNCVKTFCIVKPDCLTVDKVFWSDGTITEGDDCNSINIDQLSPLDPGRSKQKISALIMMTNGCYYCWEEEYTCGCCEGVSGSLSITPDPDGTCVFTFEANVTTTEECPQAYIELQIVEEGMGCPEFSDDCSCEQTFPGNTADPPCEGWDSNCVMGLGNGSSFTTLISGHALIRYRVVDGPCGCGSEWIEMRISCGFCDCCEGTVYGIAVTITNWTGAEGGDCADGCDAVNRRFVLQLQAGQDCQWCYNCGPGSLGFDDFLQCDPEDPFSRYGIQIFATIGCGEFGFPSGPEIDASLSISVTAGASATFTKYAFDIGFPGDCSSFDGSAPLTAATDAVCSGAGASCDVEFLVS